MEMIYIRLLLEPMKIDNWIESWIKTIGQNGSLMKLSGFTSKEFWNTQLFMQR